MSTNVDREPIWLPNGIPLHYVYSDHNVMQMGDLHAEWQAISSSKLSERVQRVGRAMYVCVDGGIAKVVVVSNPSDDRWGFDLYWMPMSRWYVCLHCIRKVHTKINWAKEGF